MCGDAVTALAEAAFARADMVTRRGECAVRGGIIDVFSPIEDHPVRIEFFGDEVDGRRWFAGGGEECQGEGGRVSSRRPRSRRCP